MKMIVMVALLLLLFNPVVYSDYYPQDEYTARSYDDARVVRINYSLGESYVDRSFEEGLEEAVVNLPIFNKDRVGTTDGRLELYLGRFNYLRLDYDSEILFYQAPRLGKTRTTIRIDRGGIYLYVNHLDYGRDIQVQTPDCGVFILENGRYRINVHTRGGTEILVYRGMTEVSGEYRGSNVRSMYGMTMFNGDVYQNPVPIIRSGQNDFELWNMERNRLISRLIGYRSRYLNPAYANYEYELSRSGRWSYDSSFRTHIWIPHNPGPTWKPYYRGRWIHHPYYGNVWTSYDSWGWYTHHYGRWHWSHAYGWYWIPGNKWSPAWVSWSWTDNYYGWCPLSIWNRPVIVINNQWMRNYPYRSGFPFNSSSVIVVNKDNLWSPRIHKAALSGNALFKMKNSRINFRGRQPKLTPKSHQVSVINAKGKTVKYKKKGFLSSEKYKDRKPDQKMKVKKSGIESKHINRYSGPEKKITPEMKAKKKSRAQKAYPFYKSFPKKTEKHPNYKTPEKKGAVKKTVVKKDIKVISGKSPDRTVKKNAKTHEAKSTVQKKEQQKQIKKTTQKKDKKTEKKKKQKSESKKKKDEENKDKKKRNK